VTQSTGEGRRRRGIPQTVGDRYGRRALEGIVTDDINASERTNTLWRCARRCGQLLAGNHLYDESYVEALLVRAGCALGLPEKKARYNVRRGLEEGKLHPVTAAERRRLYSRGDALAYIVEWAEALEAQEWTGRTASRSLRLLWTYFMFAMKAGKVEFVASFRQIAEVAGVSVGTVAGGRKGLDGWVHIKRRGNRATGEPTTWKLVQRRRPQQVCGAQGKPEHLALRQGTASELFNFALPDPRRPDRDVWTRWPNGWRIYNLLHDEARTTREIQEITGLHIDTVRRICRRLRSLRLAQRSLDGDWRASDPPDGLILGAFDRAQREQRHRNERALHERSRPALIERQQRRQEAAR
jgi:hypothetical protein